MPFTPFHLGPALFFGLLLFAFIDFPTFLVANVIVDLEPLLVVFLGLDYPLHGFFHSFAGGTIIAIILAFLMFRLNSVTKKAMKFFRLEQEVTLKRVMTASLAGVYFHILLDSPLYPDIKPLYPLELNPFFSSDMAISIYIFMFCIFSLLLGLMIYIIRLSVQAMKKPKS
jgi:hypothetical protein